MVHFWSKFSAVLRAVCKTPICSSRLNRLPHEVEQVVSERRRMGSSLIGKNRRGGNNSLIAFCLLWRLINLAIEISSTAMGERRKKNKRVRGPKEKDTGVRKIGNDVGTTMSSTFPSVLSKR